MMMRSIIWAIMALPLWVLLMLSPLIVLGKEAGVEILVTLPIATLLLFFIDSRLTRSGPLDRDGKPVEDPLKDEPRRWLPPSPWMFLFALIAGIGFAILGSEVGNISLSMGDTLTHEPTVTLLPRWAKVAFSVVEPVGLILVLQGIVQRSLQRVHSSNTAMVLTIILGALLYGSTNFLHFLVLLAWPTWLHSRTKSLLLSVVAYVSGTALGGLIMLGYGPGIEGFDVVSETEVLWQPIWFDLLGGGLVALGVFPFLRWLERQEKPEITAIT